jgi:hypothetical protein
MAKKPQNPHIPNNTPIDEKAFIFWGEDKDSQQAASQQSAESLSEYAAIERSNATRRYSLDFSNLDSNTSGRPGLTKSDYYFFRPEEAVPVRQKNIIKRAEDIYQRVGLVKNVIDLMGDFAVQGIKLVHKNKRIERFYKTWFKKISGKDRSERFLNNLYKTGNVVISKQTAKLSFKIADNLYKSIGSPDIEIIDIPKIEKKEIPWKYTFIDPVFVEIAAGPLASFVQDKRYELVLPAQIRKIINAPKTDAEKSIIENLPPQIIEAAKNKRAYPLDPDKTLVFHYKKDDWQSWAYPMIYAIMDDISVIEKLKLADMAALDGAISNIRIFKLGSLEHKIAPTKAAASKLAQILGNNVGGGTMDLVWGPDIELIESKTNVHQFLGEGKYTPHLNSIYAGLGIPPTLTGTYGAAGTTNNFISLKTLTQRLQYGRDILVSFWEKEIAIIQKAMGFRYPARIEFDRMDLSNEDSEKALLIQLADRNLVSDEMIQTRFGFDYDMEKSRLNREHRERKSERMIKKSGPWHDPQLEDAYKKILLQNGGVTPSELGIELEKKKIGEKTILEMKQELVSSKIPPMPFAKKPGSELSGVPGEGRPKNSKDTKPRQQKIFTPQTGAKLVWCMDAQDKISAIINPIYLEFIGKKNLRSLSNTQINELDMLKTKILFHIEPYHKIESTEIIEAFGSIDSVEISNIIINYSVWLNKVKSSINRELSVDELKYTKATYYIDAKNIIESIL